MKPSALIMYVALKQYRSGLARRYAKSHAFTKLTEDWLKRVPKGLRKSLEARIKLLHWAL